MKALMLLAVFGLFVFVCTYRLKCFVEFLQTDRLGFERPKKFR